MAYVYALDSSIDRRVVHVVLGKKAISMVTGRTFRLRDSEISLVDSWQNTRDRP